MPPRFIFYILLLILSVMYGWKNYSKLISWQKILFWTVLTVLFSELASRALIYFLKNSMPSYHVMVSAFFIFYGLIYSRLLALNSKQKKILLFLSASGACASILNSLTVQTILFFPSYSILCLSLLTTFYSYLGFYQMLQNPGLTSPLKEPAFWFIAGNLFFYSITFFVFGYFNPLLKKAGDVPGWGYTIIFFSNFVLYSCYLRCLTLTKNVATND